MRKGLKIGSVVLMVGIVCIAINWGYVGHIAKLTLDSVVELFQDSGSGASDELMHEIQTISFDKIVRLELVTGEGSTDTDGEATNTPDPNSSGNGNGVEQVNNYPIVVVPGVMGSKLYSDAKCSKCVWSPADSLTSIISLGKHLSMSNTLYVKPCVDQNELEKGKREYGAQDAYKNLVDRLCEQYPDRQIYFFSYDFRQSNEVSAKKLEEFINGLEAEKVNLVCHSMGGLVTSQYIASNEENSNYVDKVITLGTPYEGAPKLLNAVLNYRVLSEGTSEDSIAESLGDALLHYVGGLDTKVKASFIGVAELCPNERYFNATNFYIENKTKNPLVKMNLYNKLMYEKYASLCSTIFGQDKYMGVTNAQNKIIQENTNILAKLPNSYFGVGTKNRTIKSVVFEDGETQEEVGSIVNKSVEDLIFENTGDGTVPYASATMLEEVGQSVGSKRYREFSKLNHTELVSEKEPIDWVISILEDQVDANEIPKEKSGEAYLVLRVACPVQATITCGKETLSSDPANANLSTSFGEGYIIGANDEIKMFALENRDDYQITIHAEDAGKMDYQVRCYDEQNELTANYEYKDVALEKTTVIKADTNTSGEMVLSVDHNQDNKADTIVNPVIVKYEVQGERDIRFILVGVILFIATSLSVGVVVIKKVRKS